MHTDAHLQSERFIPHTLDRTVLCTNMSLWIVTCAGAPTGRILSYSFHMFLCCGTFLHLTLGPAAHFLFPHCWQTVSFMIYRFVHAIFPGFHTTYPRICLWLCMFPAILRDLCHLYLHSSFTLCSSLLYLSYSHKILTLPWDYTYASMFPIGTFLVSWYESGEWWVEFVILHQIWCFATGCQIYTVFPR